MWTWVHISEGAKLGEGEHREGTVLMEITQPIRMALKFEPWPSDSRVYAFYDDLWWSLENKFKLLSSVPGTQEVLDIVSSYYYYYPGCVIHLLEIMDQRPMFCVSVSLSVKGGGFDT